MLTKALQIRVYGDATLPTLIYLPGLHGDWTLITAFRLAIAGELRFIEITYPRTTAWSIMEYAASIENALYNQGITQGWLLAESFGSQIAWALMEWNAAIREVGSEPPLRVEGLVLAGGFIKHPLKSGPLIMRRIGELTPNWLFAAAVRFFAACARLRHRNSPEAVAGFREFAERRTKLDRAAMRHRLMLLDEYDPRSTARATAVPVYQLAGLFDILVPNFLTRRWLKHHCPGFRGSRIFWLADHGVLISRPAESAELILNWIKQHAPTNLGTI